jgi:hypothetical protein
MITLAIDTFWGGFITCLVVELLLLIVAGARKHFKSKRDPRT